MCISIQACVWIGEVRRHLALGLDMETNAGGGGESIALWQARPDFLTIYLFSWTANP